MSAVTESLKKAQVADLMNRNVVSIASSASMTEAAATLFEHGISGAPIVDEMGRCVGVLSATDFVRLEKDRESICASGSLGSLQEMIRDQHTGSYQIVAHPFDELMSHMTSAVQTVSPEATLDVAVDVMTREKIGRLIVLDETGRPIGILTMHDVMSQLIADE